MDQNPRGSAHDIFHPADGIEGPQLAEIKPLRVTRLRYLDGKEEVKEHAWDDPHWAKAKTRSRWTGRSVFLKDSMVGPDAGEVEKTGMPIRPGSTEAMRASLATLRTELSVAQRQDPRLAEIKII